MQKELWDKIAIFFSGFCIALVVATRVDDRLTLAIDRQVYWLKRATLAVEKQADLACGLIEEVHGVEP